MDTLEKVSSTHPPKFGIRIPNRIFVGGLAPQTSEKELNEFFTKFGIVKEVKIIFDRAGVSKGYGFVTFDQSSNIEQLKSVENLTFKERRLNIGPAIKKQQPLIKQDQEIQPIIQGADLYNHIDFPPQNCNYSSIEDISLLTAANNTTSNNFYIYNNDSGLLQANPSYQQLPLILNVQPLYFPTVQPPTVLPSLLQPSLNHKYISEQELSPANFIYAENSLQYPFQPQISVPAPGQPILLPPLPESNSVYLDGYQNNNYPANFSIDPLNPYIANNDVMPPHESFYMQNMSQPATFYFSGTEQHQLIPNKIITKPPTAVHFFEKSNLNNGIISDQTLLQNGPSISRSNGDTLPYTSNETLTAVPTIANGH